VVVAISTGLLLGLALLGVSLPVDPAGRALPLWHDVMAAGLAVACYSVFFATPLPMLAWPVAVGTVAHALRWVVLTVLGASAATGAFVACLLVGLILTPVSPCAPCIIAQRVARCDSYNSRNYLPPKKLRREIQ